MVARMSPISSRICGRMETISEPIVRMPVKHQINQSNVMVYMFGASLCVLRPINVSSFQRFIIGGAGFRPSYI